MFCKECGKETNTDKDICVDCFHKEFFDLNKPLKKSTVRNFSLLRTIALFLILLYFFAYFFIFPQDDRFYQASLQKVALNFAATVAQSAGNYYANTQIKDFVGNKSDYGKRINISKGNSIVAPEDYNCTINDSSVIVTHIDGSKAEVRWRY